MDHLQLQPLLPPLRDDNVTTTHRRHASDADSIGGGRREDWIKSCTGESALQALGTRPSGVRGSRLTTTTSDIELVEKANIHGSCIFWPWNPCYRIWSCLTALGAIATVFLAPYQIAFEEVAPGTMSAGALLEIMLMLLFTVDIFVNFNLALYCEEELIFDRRRIAKEYFRGMFWVDFAGAFPFVDVVRLCASYLGTIDESSFFMLAPLRLFRFARVHHLKKLSDELRYDSSVSLLSFTLFRNFAVVAITCHFQACFMYFLARLRDFDENTWLGPIMHDSETRSERYINALYLTITTFCTVGYGDFSPVNQAEKITGSFFMLLNIIIAAWIIGSITLLMIKGDEETRDYRNSLEVLNQYGSMHGFDLPLLNKLKEQLRLQFNNREIVDDKVLKQFPSALRRKILRRLYKSHLVQTKLMTGVRPQFVDAFLTSCNVEIFSPGEEIVERGSILSDLFLLVGGLAEITTQSTSIHSVDLEHHGRPYVNHLHSHSSKLTTGDFIGEIGFFTESPQIDSVISLTVCKTLTLPRSTYMQLANQHPSSVSKILQNLLAKVEISSMQAQLPKAVAVLRAGSTFDTNSGYQSLDSRDLTTTDTESIFRERQESLTAVKELVAMHLRRNLDDQTTRLLFAASRGDTQTISVICDHGFDPNNHDYDNRTALMVASMRGNTDAARLLLRYNACPNKIDMHGSSALLEATKNGHGDIMDLLFQYGAKLSMPENQAASYLCQAVHDGDLVLLKRLLKARIDVNVADYDNRTAAHVAAAEGNVAAIRVLVEKGANVSLPDRWGNTVEDEARRANAIQVMVYLGRLHDPSNVL